MPARSSMILCGGLLLAGTALADETLIGSPPAVTNVLEVCRLSSQNPTNGYFIRLEGNVWWASPSQGRLVLQDASGAAELEMDLFQGPRPSSGASDLCVQPGQRVRLEGKATITKIGARFGIGVHGPVVDNDGQHSMTQKSGQVYLSAGLHPMRVDWFNGPTFYGLELEYEGPGLPRRNIPDAALFRIQSDASTNASKQVNGLDYNCYEGSWKLLPDFSRLASVKSGTATNFDLTVITRKENVGLQFTGFLDIPREGLYTFHLKSDDGSRLFIAETSMRLEVIGHGSFPEPRPVAIGQPLAEQEDGEWVTVAGRVTLVRREADIIQVELSAGAGRMQVEIADVSGSSPLPQLNSRIRARGFCHAACSIDGQRLPGLLLVPSAKEIELIEPAPEQWTLPLPTATEAGSNVADLPVLATASAVHRLKREEAERRYPVKIRGVTTCVQPEIPSFTIQDSTRGLYFVDRSGSLPSPPQIGELLEVEGYTDPGAFAPMVFARRVTRLGAGLLPEPVQPTWDQLLNGSLDAQYAEIQGILTAVRASGVTLRTRGGLINVELRLNGMKFEDLNAFEDALVRLRGCLFASWDYYTHQVRLGEIRLYNADFIVDQPAPADLFASPAKTAAELLWFDPQAGVFQRVKVSGQIVHAREPEYFMMQGSSGLRFIAKQSLGLKSGDLVDVVGFPELVGNASPVLQEAVVRKTGEAPLPEAKRLAPDELISSGHDATRVRIEGLLASVRATPSGQVMEMRSGMRTFAARLPPGAASVQSVALGSRLELAGIYASRDMTSFELLLNSASDITVLARPPWWTLQRLLVILGALVCGLAATGLWITQLHRQVEERTAQLGEQIQQRQRVEHQRAIEQERARIAQDLHDELGSGITEISMLAARAKSASAPDDKRNRYLAQAGDRAREMVTALDEIVWAMNPRHDSLASLVSYFSLYADRFLGLASITWHLEGPSGPPDHVVDSRLRHQLFLAFKEALTNVVRHSGATEVSVGIHVENGEVRLSIADNGRGLPAAGPTDEMDGVANMRARLEKLGGRFEVASEPGCGTIVRFFAPLRK